MDYLFLHELCHIIESRPNQENGSEYECGLDENKPYDKNPYNSQKRKYERLNETITDMLSMEATKVLHDKEIYIMEPKEIVGLDVSDSNTHSIVKKLLVPFLSKYREHIIRARVKGDKQGLFDIIGKENYEELNDVVNKVDSLVQDLIKNQTEGPVAIEYQKQLKRLEKVYSNMEKYKSREFLGDDLLKSAVSATEELTRQGQIHDGFESLIGVQNESTLEHFGNERNY